MWRGMRWQSVSSAATKSSPAAPCTRARESKLSFGPSTVGTVLPSRTSTDPLITTCSQSEEPPWGMITSLGAKYPMSSPALSSSLS